MSLSFKKKWHAEATALGLTVTILYIVFVILSTLYPDLVLEYLSVTFHGLDFTQVYQPELTTLSFVVGVISSFLTGYVIGTIHALVVHGIEQSK